MARATSEVLIGPGTLYLAVTGTAYPATPATAPASAWVDIGYSEDGWSFNVDRNTEDIEVAEEIDPIDVLQTHREIHIVGNAVQASQANLKLGLGGGTILSNVLSAAASDVLDRNALLLRVKAPGTSKNRDIRCPNVISVGAVELAYKKAPDYASIAIDYRAILVTGSYLFQIEDTP